MTFPTKGTLTEKQRQEAEEKFLHGSAADNIPKQEKAAPTASNATGKLNTKSYVLKIPNAEYLKAKFNAARLGITIGEYYAQAVAEKNQRSE